MNTWVKEKWLFLTFFQRLKRLYPKLFYFFLILTAIQLILTAIKLEATPFFLYGMFSEKIPVQDTITKTAIYIDNKDLQTFNISYRERDLLQTGIENYLIMRNNNGVDVVQTRVETKYPFLTNSLLYPYIKNSIYNKHGHLKKFEEWFKQKCSTITGQSVQQVTIINHRYLFNRNPLKAKLIARETVALF